MGGEIAVTRLSPAMASRANQVLDFIHAYFASHGQGPSLREMAAAIRASRNVAQHAIRKLAREGRIHYEPGRPRGVWPLSAEEEALRRLRGMGYVVADGRAVIGPGMAPVLDIIGAATERGVT